MQIIICLLFCLFWAFQGSREYKFPVKHIIDKLLHVTGRLWFIGLNVLCFQGFENQSFYYPCKQTWILSSLPGIRALPKPKGTQPFLLVTLGASVSISVGQWPCMNVFLVDICLFCIKTHHLMWSHVDKYLLEVFSINYGFRCFLSVILTVPIPVGISCRAISPTLDASLDFLSVWASQRVNLFSQDPCEEVGKSCYLHFKNKGEKQRGGEYDCIV